MILGRRDYFKMPRINALRRATEMIDLQPFWDRLAEMFICDTVRAKSAAAIRVARPHPITFGIAVSRPMPTFTSFANMSPETCQFVFAQHGQIVVAW
jgi:hypothetical protein